MRIGVFGGTFDPPHHGHLILASEAREQLQLDRVLWVLTPVPPHKPGQVITSTRDRVSMLKAALVEDIFFELSTVDIDRDPPHYALDTMKLLRARHAYDTLVYLMGGDSLRDLPTWHAPLAFVDASDEIGVMRRPGVEFDLDSLDASLPGLAGKVRFVDAPLIEISASDIRARVAGGRSFRYFLPLTVYQLIRNRNFYTSDKE